MKKTICGMNPAALGFGESCASFPTRPPRYVYEEEVQGDTPRPPVKGGFALRQRRTGSLYSPETG